MSSTEQPDKRTSRTVDSAACRQIARWLTEAKSAVAFTGAGISTESGIPDFRSPGGIWSQSKPVLYHDFLASEDARYEYWRQKSITHQDFHRAEPNAGHRTLAAWESKDLLRGVLTQNIDGLHQRAGRTNIIELHGTALRVSCLDCGASFDADPFVQQFLAEHVPPLCPTCKGRLKHATISFGQMLDPVVLQTAFAWSRESDLFLAIGSSLVVEPAASLPRQAAQLGARLVIINRDPTPLDDLAQFVLNSPIGETLTEISRHVDN